MLISFGIVLFSHDRVIFSLQYSIKFQDEEAENLAPVADGNTLAFNTNNAAPNNGFLKKEI